MRDTVLIIGNFMMPDKEASAIRVTGIAKTLHSIGYKVVFQGKNTAPIIDNYDHDFTYLYREPLSV